MRPVKALFFMAVAGLLTSCIPMTNAATVDSDGESITIHQSTLGLEAQNLLYLNGTSSIALADVEWHLYDLFDNTTLALNSGKLSSVNAVSNGVWEWVLELNVSEYDCTCLIVIGEQLEVDSHNSRVVYLGTSNHSPYIHEFGDEFQSVDRQYYLLSAQDLTVSVPVVLPPHSFNETFVTMHVCSAPSGNCDEEMASFNDFVPTTSNGELSLDFELDSLKLSDGYWLFSISVTDTLLHTSNTAHFRLLVDRNLPTVVLSSDAQAVEGSPSTEQLTIELPTIDEDDVISFSAVVEDGYIGGENRLTWTLVEPDGTRRAVAESEYVSQSIISIHPPFSGMWTVELLVRDTAGWLTVTDTQFLVTNVAPVVKVEIDSFVVVPNYTITLGSDEIWELNSSMSTDTKSDNQSLSFIWYVNGNTFLAGKSVLDSEKFTETGNYDIRLVVEDDNGASSETRFTLILEESSADAPNPPRTAFIVTSVLVSLLVGGSIAFAVSRSNSSDPTLPKWNGNSTSLDDTGDETVEL
ncbi:MAG: hypothetical protein DWC09_01890 [Candidatus Poseidoniales archaeon]|nr:MAG: hypothetical protein DWC09_01890 [Candidatus Poseidoniales archaeon]